MQEHQKCIGVACKLSLLFREDAFFEDPDDLTDSFLELLKHNASIKILVGIKLIDW